VGRGGRADEVQNKNLCKEKLSEKNSHAQRVAHKKVPAYGKNISCKGNVNEKNSCSLKIPHPL